MVSLTYALFHACSGYLPPEFIKEKVMSKKLDIFSLGVVIIKIMAGSEGRTRSAEMTSKKFIENVRSAFYLYQLNILTSSALFLHYRS